MKKLIIAIAAIAVCAASPEARAQQTPQNIVILDSERGATSYQTGPLERTEVGRATLKCAYRLRWAKDRAQDKWVEQTFILQCGPAMSKFYDQRVRAIDDLLQKSVPSDLETNPSAYSGGDRLTIYQNMPAGELTLTDSFSAAFYRCVEPMPQIDWRIGSQTCEILGYTCRRADCDFRGRTYTAWFTEEIPLSCGPWKFHDLPGLIMAVEESEGDYSFRIEGIEKCDEAIDIDTRQYIDSQREKYLRLKYQYLLDPIGFFSRNSGININITKEDGTRNTELEEQLRSDSLTYDFLERDYRR